MSQVYESKVLESLIEMSPTLRWIDENQPVVRQELPPEHKAATKKLENIGIVTRPSHKLLSVQKQRLQRLLRQEMLRCPRLQERCLSEFSTLLETQV